ncbi:MAG: hypothetical protein P4L36_17140 [Holophaga sp.]|nr:hypothetical protein [Holophaga sp.]
MNKTILAVFLCPLTGLVAQPPHTPPIGLPPAGPYKPFPADSDTAKAALASIEQQLPGLGPITVTATLGAEANSFFYVELWSTVPESNGQATWLFVTARDLTFEWRFIEAIKLLP